jgi:cytochrome c551/c552
LEATTMDKNMKRLVAVALLMALFLFGVLFTGTSQAQSGQPYAPGPGWHHDMMGQGMMGGMMGRHMGYGYGMQAGVPVTDMATYGRCGCGMMGGGMMGGGMMGGGMMGYDLGTSATMTDTQMVEPVGVRESFVAALESADPNRGQQLTAANTCLGCHSLDPNQMLAGPTWHDLAATAATRVQGQSAADYLYTSIVNPNTYVVKGYQPNVMIQVYGQTLGQQDVADIVKYLLTLHE